ncbi:MAG TPA: YhdP family protein [Burkholderiales bacterium]|nr:YhdP family protein [Burkholderiales bacterium]
MTNTPSLYKNSPFRGWLKRIFFACLLLAGFALITTLLALRYWFLPNIDNYRDSIAQAASRAAGQRITIGRITADWVGLRPRLSLDDVQVYDQTGRPALALNRVATTLSWLTMTTGEVRLYLLEFDQPQLNILRDPQGTIYLAGIALGQNTGGTDFGDWLLKQRHLVVRDATILWRDDKLSAPQLILKSVTLRMDNKGEHHQISLQATPPANLAAPLEVKGDFTGSSVDPDDLARWQGTMSAQLDYADIAAWRIWLPYPIEVQNGTGALRISLTLKDAQIQEANAEVYLSRVRARLRPDLPEMDLIEMRGRLGWKILDDGFELSGLKLSLTTQRGISLKPADFRVRLYPASNQQPYRGEIEANAFDLLPLVVLADRLPLPQELREQLVDYSPRGSVYDMALKWSGDLPMPTQYSVKGRFVNLSLNPQEQWPGFSGISGTIQGNEQGGQLTLETNNARVVMPKVFEEVLKFDNLNVRLGWTVRDSRAEFSLNHAVFSNSDLSGNVQGNYVAVSQGPGVVDLSGSLNRVEAGSLNRYLPRMISKGTRDWLANAPITGTFSDVNLRLKGDLADFPFADESKGLLQVTAKANGVNLKYSSDWPKVENITADLQINGKRMEAHASHAEYWGAKLAKVDAVIPEIGNQKEAMQVEGEAEATGEKFLRFLESYSTHKKIRDFAEGVHADGEVKLQMNLSIPLSEKLENTYKGVFHFNDNQLSFDPDLPPIEHLKGELRFSESTVDAKNLGAQILGGPAQIDIATRDGDINISAQGKANADAGEKISSWMKYLHGSAEWQGRINITDKLTDMVFESDLRAIASLLPAPLDKAADTAVPLRFERRIPAARQERILLSYGKVVSMNLLLRKEGEHSIIERGAVAFGAAAGRPDKSGIWVSGVLKNLDIDQWSDLLNQPDSTSHIDIAGIDVKFDTLDAFGRRFHDLHVDAIAQGKNWQSTVDGKEIKGEVIWQPQDKGKLIANLSNLTIPGVLPEKKDQQTQKIQQKDFPALDVSVDDFVLFDKALGKLELQAVQQGRNWRIENLRLSNSDAVLTMDGVWLAWITQPQTQVNLKLEVANIGNLLARLKLPPGIKGGTAKLEGALSWASSPQSIDYPTLSGNLQLKAEKGQFAELEPGVAKLLGILSLQALPRRITLDFHDMFSKGFAFDSITSSINFSQGVATTDKLRITGPLADVNMSGQVNIDQETQQLNVKVTPTYTSSLALAGLLVANPIIGATAYLVQKAFKDPLGHLITYEYNITGTWVDPVVTKLSAAPAQGMQLWQNP